MVIGLIKFNNVSKEYKGGTKSLDSIDLTISKGEFVFLVGHSGAGKSTLLKLLTREESITDGSLVVLDKDLIKLKNRRLYKYRRKLGVVFQDFRLLNDKTVYGNVELALRVVGANPRHIKPRVMEALSKVGLSDKAKSYPSELSGGECQRVGIARAIVNKPDIIIADECTGNLDVDNSIKVLQLLKEINEEGVTVIASTHDTDVLEKFSERVVELKDGKIIKDTKGRG